MANPTSTPPRPSAVAKWLPRVTRLLVAVGMTAVVGWLLLALAGTFHHKTPEISPTSAARFLSDETVAEVTKIRRPRFETAVGTIKPVHEASVAAKLLARVTEVRVKAGQAVTEGEVLVQLDDADLQARLKQAEAAVTSARAKKEQADLDFNRTKQLFEKKVTTKADFDQADAAKQSATADWQRAQQLLNESQILLAYATIVSPLTGTVVDKKVEVGDTVTPGQTLLTLYDPTHMQMVASVRESLALRLKVGQQLPASLESLGYECEATVSEIVPEAQSASRSFTVKVTGPCPPGVYSGMFGRLKLPLDEEELVVVPDAALQRVGQLTMVDVVGENNRLERRSVQLGRELARGHEVLSGLVPGEKVALPAANDSARKESR